MVDLFEFDFDFFEGRRIDNSEIPGEQDLLYLDEYIEEMKQELKNDIKNESEKEKIKQRLEICTKYKRKMSLEMEKIKNQKHRFDNYEEREMQELYGPPSIIDKHRNEKILRLYIETDNLIYKYILLNHNVVSFGRNEKNYLEWFGKNKMLLFDFESPELFGYNLLSNEIVTLNGNQMELKQKTKLNKDDIIRFENQNTIIKISDIQFDEDN